MEYRWLGHSGVRVSVIGLGTNRFGSKVPQEEVNQIINAAEDLGINFIDTANVYTGGQSEETLGKALKGRWDRFVVATKFFLPMGEGPNDRGASRYHMLNALEASLRRLQSDHIDLYYVHRWVENTPIEETLRAFELWMIRFAWERCATWELPPLSPGNWPMPTSSPRYAGGRLL